MGEACDDGNTANGDGCSAMCAIESCPDGQTRNQQGQCVEFVDPSNPNDIEDCGCTAVPAQSSETGTNSMGLGLLLLAALFLRRRRR